MVIRRVLPVDADALALTCALDADLSRRYPEARVITSLDPADTASPRLIFIVAYADDVPVACGAIRQLDATTGEVKRMFVVPERRKQGFARAILEALESHARVEGYATLKIETGPRQKEAVGLYRSLGYRDIPPFGKYIGSPHSICFAKEVLSRSPAPPPP